MTVKELIEKLQEFDGDRQVRLVTKQNNRVIRLTDCHRSVSHTSWNPR